MKLYDVIYAPAAEIDLRGAYEYIAERASPATGEAYIERVQDACNSLSSAPFRGTLHEEISKGCRTFGFEGRATILFRVDEAAELVVILGIFFGGREVRIDD